MKKWFLFLVAGMILFQPVYGQEDDDFAFSDGDFDLDIPEVELNIDIDETTATLDRAWDLYGFFQLEGGNAFEKEDGSPALAKLKTTLNLTFDYKFNRDWKLKINGNAFYDYAYKINGEDKYTQETLDTFEKESEFRDTYIEGDLGSGFSVRIGRQIIAWGESDLNQINDMANPRDNREVGMVELEDARVSVTASLLNWAYQNWRVDMAAIHEYRANKIAPEGSEFDPLITKRESGMTINNEELPDSGGEWVGRIIKSFNGGDIGLYSSETYNDAFYLDFHSLSLVSGKAQLSVTPKHQKITSLGISANKVIGSLLIKGEMAQKEGIYIQRSDIETQIKSLLSSGSLSPGKTLDEESQAITTYEEKEQIQHMLGIEYMGISDLILTLEANRSLIKEWDETLASAQKVWFSFSSATYKALNDTLTNRLVWIHYADDEGDVYRWTIDYDVSDGLNVASGVVLYESPKSDSFLEPYKNNDRLTLSTRYSF